MSCYYLVIDMPCGDCGDCDSVSYGPFLTPADARYWAQSNEKLNSSKWQWHISSVVSCLDEILE